MVPGKLLKNCAKVGKENSTSNCLCRSQELQGQLWGLEFPLPTPEECKTATLEARADAQEFFEAVRTKNSCASTLASGVAVLQSSSGVGRGNPSFRNASGDEEEEEDNDGASDEEDEEEDDEDDSDEEESSDEESSSSSESSDEEDSEEEKMKKEQQKKELVDLILGAHAGRYKVGAGGKEVCRPW